MSRKGAASHLLFVTLFPALIAGLVYIRFEPFSRVELATQDAVARFGRKAPAHPDLVFVALDNASLSVAEDHDLNHLLHLDEADAESKQALQMMANPWPWPRELHALVLRRLMQAGVREVMFDLSFPKPSVNDGPLAEALEQFRERVTLVGNITDEERGARFNPPASSLIRASLPRDRRIGFANYWSDLDGIVRRAAYRWVAPYGVWETDEELSLVARAAQHLGFERALPPGRESHRFRFAGPAGTFPKISIFRIFAPEYWKRSYRGGEFFRDKIVIIGAEGDWARDDHRTPHGMMTGAELHLNALNAIFRSSFIHELPRIVEVLLVVCAGVLPGLIRHLVRRPLARFVLLLASSVGWGFAAFKLYDLANLFVPTFAPLLALNLSGLSGLVLDVFIQRRDQTQLRRTLERHLSRNVVEELIDNPDQYTRALGGEVRAVTILFSDVRDFTHFAAAVDSRTLVAQLNEYFSAMVDCVFRFGGSLDKFIGDAIMAVWGNTRSAGPAADGRNAVMCALAMRVKLVELNRRWRAEGRPELRIGIGINAGEVVVGNIGSPTRMEFTVIGDAVDIAWRLQESTKRLKTDILLGEGLLCLLGDEFPTERWATIFVSGDTTVECARLALGVATGDEGAGGSMRESASPRAHAHR